VEEEGFLNVFEHNSSFYGVNEAIYGCGVPRDWCAKAGAKPTWGRGGRVELKRVAHQMYPSHGGGLTSAAVYGPDGTRAAERRVLLKLLKELQDVLKLGSAPSHPHTVVHLPMIVVCAKKWAKTDTSSEIDENELQQVCEYIAKKTQIRADMEQCVTAMHDQMHHVTQAAFRFVMLRSLPHSDDTLVQKRHTLPMRSSDDRVAQVARAHLYLMLAIAKHRDMRTTANETIFFVGDNGLEMHNTRLWSANDWVGFSMITDVALSAEGGLLGREQASVPLLVVPSYMISRSGIVKVPRGSHDATSVVELMAAHTQQRLGTTPVTSFLVLGPSFSDARCAQLLRLNWNSYKYLRPNAKTDDVTRLCKTHPWKGYDTQIAPEQRRAATTLFAREYERFTYRDSHLPAEDTDTALPPLTHNETMDEDELFGCSDSEDSDTERHGVKAPRLL
jgi:hypothetical protein